MATQISPYLALDGTAREALEYYHSILGGELTISTLGDFNLPMGDPNRVMHGQLVYGPGAIIFASDTMEGMPHTAGDTIAVSLTGSDDKLGDVFAKLADGGQVNVPFEKQMWGDEYGQVRDRFGVLWHVNKGTDVA